MDDAHDCDEVEARRALALITARRSQVIAEIDVPDWYWWGLALAWIALGVVTDLHNPWLTSAGTLAVGAGHAMVAQWVIGGRRRTSQLSVRREVAGRFVPVVVIVTLLGLAGATVLFAVIAIARHVSHPVTVASTAVAAILVLGGPRVMAVMRRRALKVHAAS